MTTKKKLILNLDNNQHIITESSNDTNKNLDLNKVDILDIDTNSVIKKKEKRKKDEGINNLFFDTNIVNYTTNDINISDNNIHSNDMNNNVVNNNSIVDNDIVTEKDNNYKVKLDKYLVQQKDIEKKLDKLNKRILDPKYDSKKSLYISDIEKCNNKLQKLIKNINICKQNLNISNIKEKTKSKKSVKFNTNLESPTILQPNKMVNNPTVNMDYLNNVKETTTNVIEYKPFTMDVKKADLHKSKDNKNIEPELNKDIENELNKLESDLKLSTSIVPSINNKIQAHIINSRQDINNVNSRDINNKTNSKTFKNNKDSKDSKDIKDTINSKANKDSKSILKKKKKESTPVSINGQLRTLKEKENFYKEQQRRIKEKFNLEMQKINKLKQQQQEIHKLKQLDKQKKQTFILEQKLKKIERYKFLINKLTNIECINAMNNDTQSSKQLLNKEKIIQSYQPFTYNKQPNTKNKLILNNILTGNTKSQLPTQSNTENGYFNKIINYINNYGFMGVGESIYKSNSKSKNNTNLNSNSNNKQETSSRTKLNESIKSNSTTESLINSPNINNKKYEKNNKYDVITFKCKYSNIPLSYYELNNKTDSLWSNSFKEENTFTLLDTIYNNCNKIINIDKTFKYDKINLETLNSSLKDNNLNIPRTYFNKYSNKFKLDQFKDSSNYLNFNYDKIISNVMFKNRFVSNSQIEKYKIIDFLNQIYQNIDKSLNIRFV